VTDKKRAARGKAAEEAEGARQAAEEKAEAAAEMGRESGGATAAGEGKAAAETVEEKAEAAAEAGGEERRPLTDEERAKLYREQLKALRLLDVARDMMLTLVTVGYQKLGLTDETRELRDLDEARLAIELLRGVIGAVEGAAEAEELETYRSTLAQMQMSYARVAADA